MSRMIHWRFAVNLAAGLGFWLAASGIGLAQDVEVSQVGWWRQRPCPRGTVPVYPSEVAPTEVQPAPTETRPPETRPTETIPPEAMTPPANALAGGIGAAAGPGSAAPNMIGDFFGGGAVLNGGPHGFTNASVGIDGGDRRFKIVEGNNPIPSDRAFVSYNHFTNPLLDVNDRAHDLDRFIFGLEKTFRDGLWSVEFRVPFAAGYNSTQSLDPGAQLTATEFGDLALAIKRIILRRDEFIVSAGVGIVFPTGPDWRILDVGAPICQVRNEAVHLQPFLGASWKPTERLFVLAFGQLDFDTRGNDVLMATQDGPDSTPGPLLFQGVYREQSLAFIDLSVGYWIYKCPEAHWVTAIAPMVEIHYSSTMQNTDNVTGPQGTITSTAPVDSPTGGSDTGRRDVLNLTGGLHFQLGQCSTLTVAAVAPLRTGINRDFASEFVVQFNRRF